MGPTSEGVGRGSGSGSGSGATHAIIGAGLLTSTPVGGLAPGASAKPLASDPLDGATSALPSEKSGQNRSLFDGNVLGNVEAGTDDSGSGFAAILSGSESATSAGGGSGIIGNVKSLSPGDAFGCFDTGSSDFLPLFVIVVSVIAYLT